MHVYIRSRKQKVEIVSTLGKWLESLVGFTTTISVTFAVNKSGAVIYSKYITIKVDQMKMRY